MSFGVPPFVIMCNLLYQFVKQRESQDQRAAQKLPPVHGLVQHQYGQNDCQQRVDVTQHGCFLAGQIAGMVTKPQPAAEIVREVTKEAETCLKGASKWLS